jgi:hypothetical protein
MLYFAHMYRVVLYSVHIIMYKVDPDVVLHTNVQGTDGVLCTYVQGSLMFNVQTCIVFICCNVPTCTG